MVFKTLKEAMDQLHRDPSRPVRVSIDELDVEIRAVPEIGRRGRLGDFLASLGPWEGESLEQLMSRLRQARDAGGSAEAPAL